ncbi:FUSC family protein [Gryllotalpicola protaetiae]|uniref:FUSC family protein n=1 Tax=Gryllotalpicola protaetiae TaxID=2419771 RepID=A0A387BIX0_9MICO|nr:FUSC family protein [Gryllotalpicola protaetiae]AYG03763.1 FUSC family protein [Gryllotalpicola protaetiae]
MRTAQAAHARRDRDRMPGGCALGPAARRALTPAARPLAVLPAARTVAAVLACAVLGFSLGDPAALGVMYFGAACAAVFVTPGVYRARALALAAQALGAAAGLGLGALPVGLTGTVVVAAAVAFVSGAAGAIGPLFTAGALMAVIGVAFGQFSGLAMPWWQQALWYLLGTAVVAVPALLPWAVRARTLERRAVAEVFRASADLLDAVGTADAPERRADLASRSAAAQASVLGYRLTPPRRRPEILVELAAAQRAALDAATHYASGAVAEPGTANGFRAEGRLVRAGRPSGAHEGAPPVMAPWGRSALANLRRVGPRALLLAGARLAWCMALATAAAGLLHHAGHSYWLPLTVAVVVRTEYGSVFARTVNRIGGTVGGAFVAAVALSFLGSGWPLVPVAACAIGFAVLVAPRLYALSVVGITASALLSACFAGPDAVLPALRLGDTAIGCAIALVFGYLLWPGRRSLPGEAHFAATAHAAVDYLREIAATGRKPDDLPRVREDAYRAAHESRAAAAAVAADPTPSRTGGDAALPVAVALEDAVDGVSALDAALRAGRRPLGEHELDELEHAILACAADGAVPAPSPAQIARRLLGARR